MTIFGEKDKKKACIAELELEIMKETKGLIAKVLGMQNQ